jgi:hypothetical protein
MPPKQNTPTDLFNTRSNKQRAKKHEEKTKEGEEKKKKKKKKNFTCTVESM